MVNLRLQRMVFRVRKAPPARVPGQTAEHGVKPGAGVNRRGGRRAVGRAGSAKPVRQRARGCLLTNVIRVINRQMSSVATHVGDLSRSLCINLLLDAEIPQLNVGGILLPRSPDRK